MALYLDLHPTPQFDASLVSYLTVNFERVRDILLTAGKRTAVQTLASVVGPFPKPISVTVPFKCDIVVWAEATFYSSVAGAMCAMAVLWDGTNPGLYMEMAFNESYSHKAISTSFVMRNIAPGTHTVSQTNALGSPLHDSADRFRCHLTYHEL